MTDGFLYVATGERRFTLEAIRSARSLRAHWPEADICLFTDHFHGEVPDYDVFTRLQKLPASQVRGDAWLDHLQWKIAAMVASPYTRTAFIDADTVVCSPRIRDIFSTLEGFDVAISERKADNSVSRQIFGKPMYSTGVIAYNSSPAVHAMLKEWNDVNAKNLADMHAGRVNDVVAVPGATAEHKKFLMGTDQYSLALILSPDTNRHGLKVGPLDTRYNFSHMDLPTDELIVDHRPNLKMRGDAENSDGFFKTFYSLICETFLGVPLHVRQGLVQLVRTMAKPQDDPTKSGVGAYRTESSLLYLENPYVAYLKQALSKVVPRMFLGMFQGKSNLNGPMTLILEGWGYILKPGDFIGPHQHTSAVIAGTYYLTVPEVSRAPGGEGGHLVLQNPNMAECYSLRDHLVYSKITLQPSEDKLVLFPSYLWHHVLPFRGEGERIAISFDVIPQRRK